MVENEEGGFTQQELDDMRVRTIAPASRYEPPTDHNIRQRFADGIAVLIVRRLAELMGKSGPKRRDDG